MKVTIEYDPHDEVEPAAAKLLAQEVRASDQFGPDDVLVVITVAS